MSTIERIRVNVGNSFDPRRHTQKLMEKIEENGQGVDWELESVTNGQAVLTREGAVTQIAEAIQNQQKVSLPKGTKPSDGERMSVRLADGAGPGWEMTQFEPYLGVATLTKLSKAEALCRKASATALGSKPWEVQVKSLRGGGFLLELPDTYVSSKHDAKLEEVATMVVGSEGWYLKVNQQNRSVEFVPSAPSTFPAGIPTPMDTVVPFDHTNPDTFKIPLGMKLPEPGETVGDVFALDMGAGSHLQIGGISGGGKAGLENMRLPVPVSDRFPAGWATNRELITGDSLFAPDGTMVKVSGFSEWTTEPVYEVEFYDRQVVKVSANHLWKVSTEVTRRAHARSFVARREAHHEDFQARAEEIREAASRLPAGTVGSLLDISAMAGFHRNAATAMKLPIEHLATTAAMSTTRVANQFDVGHFSGTLLETPAVFQGLSLTAETLSGKGISGWLTMREIADGMLGRPANRTERAGMSKLLRLRNIASRESNGKMLMTVYPADEVLTMLADRVDKMSFTSDSGRQVIDLETVMDTRSMAKDFKYKRKTRETVNYAVRLTQAIDPPEAPLPMDPYAVGAWLGDGLSSALNRVVSMDREIVDNILAGDTSIRRIEDIPGLANIYVFDNMTNRMKEAGFGTKRGAHQPTVKHIPPAYLRASKAQRLALLQGLMDTDGHIKENGGCELTLSDNRLAFDALELIRSLGIRVNTPKPEKASYKDENGVEVICKDRYRMKFTTDLPVFRLQRKVDRLPTELRATQDWNYIVDIRVSEPKRMRCIAVDHPEHLFLVEGFIPTHNTVLLNCYLATWLAKGAELAIIDLPTKSADFEWCKDFVRPGGWGCASPAQSAVAIRLIMAEGERRARVIKDAGVNDWKMLPRDRGLPPLIVIVDELTGLFALEAVPKVKKDSPQLLQDMALDAEKTNLFKEILKNGIKRIAAELRFTGVFLTLATQVASANTGIEPALRTNLHHKMLMGAKPTEGNRRLVFSDPERVPLVPENVKSDGKASRGVGSSEPEGDEPAIFKSYFATVTEYRSWLERLGVPQTNQPEPTRAQMAELEDAFEVPDQQGAKAEATAQRREAMPDPMAAAMGGSGYDENGRPLKGAALAAAQTKHLQGMSNQAGRA